MNESGRFRNEFQMSDLKHECVHIVFDFPDRYKRTRLYTGVN